MPVKALSYRDRTLDFQNAAERLKKSLSSAASASNGPSSSGAGKGYDGGLASAVAPQQWPQSGGPIQSEFNRRASRIALGIHQTSQKLSKLAQCQ